LIEIADDDFGFQTEYFPYKISLFGGL
jgi:hypothetical protein